MGKMHHAGIPCSGKEPFLSEDCMAAWKDCGSGRHSLSRSGGLCRGSLWKKGALLLVKPTPWGFLPYDIHRYISGGGNCGERGPDSPLGKDVRSGSPSYRGCGILWHERSRKYYRLFCGYPGKTAIPGGVWPGPSADSNKEELSFPMGEESSSLKNGFQKQKSTKKLAVPRGFEPLLPG